MWAFLACSEINFTVLPLHTGKFLQAELLCIFYNYSNMRLRKQRESAYMPDYIFVGIV